MTFLLPCKQLRLALFTENEVRSLRDYVEELRAMDKSRWKPQNRIRAWHEVRRIERKLKRLEAPVKVERRTPVILQVRRKAARHCIQFPGVHPPTRFEIRSSREYA